MRKKLDKEIKRHAQIGIKVRNETKEKLIYIAKREGTTLSTQIDKILTDYIKQYFEIAKINWYTEAEDGESPNGM